MRTLATWGLWSSLLVSAAACQDDDPPASRVKAAAPVAARPAVPQIAPPFDIRKPPPDATRTASGLTLKKLVSNPAGALPKRTETAMVQYTGWSQRTGTTFFSTRGRGEAIALDIAHAAPGFSEALQLLHKGEKAVLWVPPSPGSSEPLVYEVELVDIVTPPAAATAAPKAT